MFAFEKYPNTLFIKASSNKVGHTYSTAYETITHTYRYQPTKTNKNIYLKQQQFVLCVASTKSQDVTLSAVSSSHRPADEAEYFLLRFEIIELFRIHQFFCNSELSIKIEGFF